MSRDEVPSKLASLADNSDLEGSPLLRDDAPETPPDPCVSVVGEEYPLSEPHLKPK